MCVSLSSVLNVKVELNCSRFRLKTAGEKSLVIHCGYKGRLVQWNTKFLLINRGKTCKTNLIASHGAPRWTPNELLSIKNTLRDYGIKVKCLPNERLRYVHIVESTMLFLNFAVAGKYELHIFGTMFIQIVIHNGDYVTQSNIIARSPTKTNQSETIMYSKCIKICYSDSISFVTRGITRILCLGMTHQQPLEQWTLKSHGPGELIPSSHMWNAKYGIKDILNYPGFNMPVPFEIEKRMNLYVTDFHMHGTRYNSKLRKNPHIDVPLMNYPYNLEKFASS